LIKLKLLYRLLFLFCNIINADVKNNFLNFSSHKIDGYLQPEFLQYLKENFKCNIFFETGTYAGATSQQASKIFDKVYTTELYEPLYKAAVNKFKNHKNVYIYKGHSPAVLDTILPTLKKEKIIFWLDAHYSGNGTAKGAGETAEDITPIRKEIQTILKHSSLLQDFVILIDDIRGFGSRINSTTYIGCWAYPTLQEITETILQTNKNFSFAVLGDILLCYDSSKHSPSFSPVVQSITKSRLYNGKNYSNEELLQAEQIIMQAQNQERKFIEDLYKMMCTYKDPEFHYKLWYGLINLGNKNYKIANDMFNNIIEQHNYTDLRIYQYKNSCK